MSLLRILSLDYDPQKFKFYAGGKGYVSNTDSFGQKSIRYGNDRFGGADSGQPYIQTNIPEDISSYIGTQDYINRGGIKVVRDSITDVKRLGKMFLSTKSPNGIFFTGKQLLLSRTAVRTQTSGILNEGIYTPLSTLAQAGVVAFGGHLNKQGINPFRASGAYAEGDYLYFNKVKPNPNDPAGSTASNRLVDLYSTKIEINTGSDPILRSYTGGPGSFLGVGKTNIRFADQRTGISNDYGKEIVAGTYQTTRPVGRDSLLKPPLGVANKWFEYTKAIDDVSFPELTTDAGYTYELNQSQNGNNNDTWTYTQQDIFDTPANLGGRLSPSIQDFRKELRNNLKSTQQRTATESGATAFSLDYNTDNVGLRVNLGDPGQRANRSYASYNNGVIDTNTNKSIYPNITPATPVKLGTAVSGLDRITSIPIYRSVSQTTDSDVNDLVKFRIDIIDNDSPNFKTFIHFRAFLDSMSDSYNAKWNNFQYLGRGENFYNYGGFDRQMSLSWTVAAQSKQELIPMYKKLNYLASSLTPDYSSNGYMRGNLARLTVGGYVYEMPGIIQGFTYDMSESTWEVGVGVRFNTGGNTIQGDKSVKELPHVIKVTGFTFIPIPYFLPQIQQNTYWENGSGFPTGSYGPERFISLANGGGPQRNNYDLDDLSTNQVQVPQYLNLSSVGAANINGPTLKPTPGQVLPKPTNPGQINIPGRAQQPFVLTNTGQRRVSGPLNTTDTRTLNQNLFRRAIPGGLPNV